MNVYLVAFDRDSRRSYREFHESFVRHPEIKNWFHYLKCSYIVCTNLTPKAVADHFAATARKYEIPVRHLVVEVDLTRRAGYLPKDAWDWIVRRVADQAKNY